MMVGSFSERNELSQDFSRCFLEVSIGGASVPTVYGGDRAFL